MKPTLLQQQTLKKYLRKNLRYRETYTEFYDHILSAVELEPETVSFQQATNKIMNDDFGGIEGMTLIERRYQKTVFKEIQKKYFNHAMAFKAAGYRRPCRSFRALLHHGCSALV